MDDRLAQIFPPLGLRITCGPLELRGIGDAEMLALLDLAKDGIHPPEEMPFAFPWTDAPAEELPLNYLQWWTGAIANWKREKWALDLCVLWEGEVVGVQGAYTTDFPTLGHGETGSWLGRRHQGRGIGTAMRQAICAFLFDHLDFGFITSSAYLDNPASLRVSEKLGYRPNGVNWRTRRGEAATMQQLVLTRDTFVRGPGITVEGAAAMRRFVGVLSRP